MASAELQKQIEKNCRDSFSGIYPKDHDFAAMAREFVDPARVREELHRISTVLSLDLRGKALLEIGSGYGMLVAVARSEFGADAFGVEPAEQFAGAYEASLQLLREMCLDAGAVRKGCGEDIPFDNNRFDVVYSSNVLEHVRDPGRVLGEALRVVRPGGHMVAVIPNYGSWWEGHYGMLMPPHSPAWLLKGIVRLFGRDASFIDTLQLITYRKLVRWLKPCREFIDVIDWGGALWQERVRTLAFSEWAQLGRLKKLVRVIHALKLTEMVLFLGRLFHWETPFVLVIRKR